MQRECPELPALIKLHPELAKLSLADLFSLADVPVADIRKTLMPEASNEEVKV